MNASRGQEATVVCGDTVHPRAAGGGRLWQRQSSWRRIASGDLKNLVVGSADFPESKKIIAEIYAQALEANGFTVGRQFGIGSRETYIPAVRDHSIDLVPEYTGNLLQYFDSKTTVTTPDQVELALFRVLPGDLSILTPSPANDTDTVAVSEATAQKWNLKTIGDLAAHSPPEVKFGAPPSEFLNRTEGLPGLKAKYGLDIRPDNFVAISDGGGPATVRALTDGTVTAADIFFSTSPAIPQNKLVVLEDPQEQLSGRQRRAAGQFAEEVRRTQDGVGCGVGQAEYSGSHRSQHRRIGKLRRRPPTRQRESGYVTTVSTNRSGNR